MNQNKTFLKIQSNTFALRIHYVKVCLHLSVNQLPCEKIIESKTAQLKHIRVYEKIYTDLSFHLRVFILGSSLFDSYVEDIYWKRSMIILLSSNLQRWAIKSANGKFANSWAHSAIAIPQISYRCASPQIANSQIFMLYLQIANLSQNSPKSSLLYDFCDI